MAEVESKAVDGVSAILAAVGRLGGLAIGVSVLGYCYGWKLETAYFTQLGIPWATSLCTAGDFIESSLGFTIPFMTAAIYSMIWMISKENPERLRKTARRFQIAFAIAGAAAICLHLLAPHYSEYSAQIDTAASYLVAGASGFAMGEVSAWHSLAGLRWNYFQINALYIMFFVVMLPSADWLGVARAKADRAHLSQRPWVIAVQQDLKLPWRLIAVRGGQFIVVQAGEDSRTDIYRVLSNTSIETVTSVEK